MNDFLGCQIFLTWWADGTRVSSSSRIRNGSRKRRRRSRSRGIEVEIGAVVSVVEGVGRAGTATVDASAGVVPARGRGVTWHWVGKTQGGDRAVGMRGWQRAEGRELAVGHAVRAGRRVVPAI